MAKQTIYTVGGTVQAGGGIYIKRQADDELIELCRAGELAFILSSRQVGKSSLMTQTAEQLRRENIRSATVDLSSIGTKVSPDEWYLGILNVIATDLNLGTNIFAWWTQYSGLGPAQRFFNFLRDVMLKEIQDCIVLFFDEIDTTLSLPFADDFFASVRAVYNARSTTPDFKRLSFVLVGVATPSDLISDNNRTPFNIGHRVDLDDFTLEEALPLAQGLGENAEQVLAWILDWSGGHPYLTQRLCSQLSKKNSKIEKENVAQVVGQLFLGDPGQQDNNLQFVRDLLVKRSPDVRKVMLTYKDIRSGKPVVDDERSIVKAHLKISGLVKRQADNIVIRNRIYERVFDPEWIKENTPSAVPRRIMIGSTLVLLFVLFIATYFVYQERSRPNVERADRFTHGFQNANDAQTRLRNLAGICGLDGYLNQANILFNQLTQEQKLQLFAKDMPGSARKYQPIVVERLRRFMSNTEDDNALLLAMNESIKDTSPSLAREITAWLKGREELNRKRYLLAVSHLSIAIEENLGNAALYYDRAQAYIELGNTYFPDALGDLVRMIQIDADRGVDANRLIQSNAEFNRYWMDHKEEKEFELLVSVVPAPTATLKSTLTTTPTPSRTPTLTATVTNTPFDGLIFCVNVPAGISAINVRSGPGTNYPPVEEPLQVGSCLFFDARNEDATWLHVSAKQPDPNLRQYEGGWIHRELLGLGSAGPIDLRAVTLTPTPSATPTP